MSARTVDCWTIICDLCGRDAAEHSDYAGIGPGPSEARAEFCELWERWLHLDICDECSVALICATCGEEDMGWAGNCASCWEDAERAVWQTKTRQGVPS